MRHVAVSGFIHHHFRLLLKIVILDYVHNRYSV
uniref:Uncharacterized protein n=1 Tax=Arundo donax TaxID=35708 RepID=A0A0A9HIM0_ARUDO